MQFSHGNIKRNVAARRAIKSAPKHPSTTAVSRITKGGAAVATSKQLSDQLEKLSARIKKQQVDLTTLKTRQKEMKAKLSEAKKSDKAKKAAKKK